MGFKKFNDSNPYATLMQVVIKDLVGTNGILHVIDGVIVPPSARYEGG